MHRLAKIPRVLIGMLPTPIIELKNLSKILNGPRIFMKRDDLVVELGGNKIRKIEYLYADAINKGYDTIITCGIVQSNYCRQAALAATKVGLKCHLVLGGPKPEELNYNTLLMKMFGAELHWNPDPQQNDAKMEEVAEKLRTAGYKPYVLPCGGSTTIGTLGYTRAFMEASEQLKNMNINIDTMITASSSSGTQAGLLLGATMENYKGRIIGIQTDEKEPKEKFIANVKNLMKEGGKICGMENAELTVEYDERFLGEGYEKIGALEKSAISFLAKNEGILLDPLYTARAMGAFISMTRAGEFKKGENVLFWHTGGGPSIFVHHKKLENLE